MKYILIVLTCSLLLAVAGCSKILHGEATIYAPNFSEKNFQKVKSGMSISEVYSVAGQPMLVVTQTWVELWMYRPTSPIDPTLPPSRGHTNYHPQGGPPFLQFTKSSTVEFVSTNYLSQELLGMSKQEVVKLIGPPNWSRVDPYRIVFHYSDADRIKGSGTYWKRKVIFGENGRVSSIDSSLYYD